MPSIRTVERKSGTSYEVRIHRGNQPAQSKTFRTYEDAKKWGRQTEAKIDNKENVSRLGESLLLRDVCADFLANYRNPKGNKPPTAGDKSMVPRMALHFPEKTKISDITRKKVDGYIPILKSMPIPEADNKKKNHPLFKGGQGRTYSGNTARKYYFTLKKVLIWASIRYRIPLDPTLFVGIGIPGAWEDPRERRLEVETNEEARLLDAGAKSIANKEHWPLLIRFFIETAARSQEVLLAQWKEFNIAGEAWNIPKEHVKTGDARQVPLSRPAIAVLAELGKLRKDPTDSDELLFPCWNNSAALALAFKRLIKRAKIENLTVHDLRHEAISRLFQTKMSDVEIMKMTGHTNASTLARYSHHRASDVAAKINQRWDEKAKPAKSPTRKASRG